MNDISKKIIEAKNEEIEDLTSLLDNLKSDIKEKETAVEELKARLDNSNNEKESFNQMNSKFKDEIDLLYDKLKEIDEEKMSLQKDNENLVSKLIDLFKLK